MAHSEQQFSANMVATVVLVVFERFAFAAENLNHEANHTNHCQTIQNRRQPPGACKKRSRYIVQNPARYASDCDKHLYVCIPARLLMPHYPRLLYFFDMPVLKWFTFDLLFSPTHTWWHMDAIFSQNSRAAQQLRKLMFGCLLREGTVSLLRESNLWIHERVCAPFTV